MRKTIYTDPSIQSSEITPEPIFLNRRNLMKSAGALASGAIASSMPQAAASTQALAYAPDGDRSLEDELTPFKAVTTYNNFYEFGTGKDDPEKYGQDFKPHPWQVTVSGLAEGTGTFDLEDLLKGLAVEERIYRLRCVEAWSMVIPWLGVSMAALLKRLKPLSSARYVTFETVYRPEEMPGQASFFAAIDYPYIEALRMDEAMHPLTLMATGVYGRSLPNQNGAPLRLVVPWKYGFKSIKSIRKITFTDRQPQTTWQKANAREYGFYANVNPAVDHPRWRQSEERRLPSTLFASNRVPTLPFNGYAEAVAGLYQGMDLTKHY